MRRCFASELKRMQEMHEKDLEHKADESRATNATIGKLESLVRELEDRKEVAKKEIREEYQEKLAKLVGFSLEQLSIFASGKGENRITV
jgi:hypothetical protein